MQSCQLLLRKYLTLVGRTGKPLHSDKKPFATKTEKFSGNDIPTTEINVSPHTHEYAKKLIDAITEKC